MTAAGQTQSLAVDGSVTFTELEAGDYGVELSGIQKNCAPDGANPATATVTAGTTTSIVFESDVDGDFEIYSIDVDGTHRSQLTSNGSLDEDPVWSPDGTKLAFMSQRDATLDIFSMNADGTGLLNLTSNPSAPAGACADAEAAPEGSRHGSRCQHPPRCTILRGPIPSPRRKR